MISTHWREVHTPDERELRRFDILARQAADFFERRRVLAELKEHTRWKRGQREALEAAINGAPLETSLAVLVRTVTEALGPPTRAAFYLSNADGTSLHHIIGMSPEYASAVDGFQIGPESLACGLAAQIGKPVVTFDVQTDPLWEPWRRLAARFGYRGCWSFPINTAAGRFVGSLAIYSSEPGEASAQNKELAALLTNTAAIIISQHMESQARKQIEAALRESEARSRALLDSVVQAFWETDASGLIMADSPTWRAYTGQAVEQLMGLGWVNAVHPDDRTFAEHQWREATEAQRPLDVEFRLRASDGGYRWSNVRALPVRDADGRIEKWVGINIDIHARKQAEAVLHVSSTSGRGH